MKKILFFNISDTIHSNNISEILILFEYFWNMYPCHRCLRAPFLSDHLWWLLLYFSNSTFLIKNSSWKLTAEKQGEICWLVAQWSSEVAGCSGEASSFGWFLGGFRWFQLVLVDIGWFQVVCCFSSCTNFTTNRRVISLLYSWTHFIDWGHLILLFKVRQQKKDYCCLVA